MMYHKSVLYNIWKVYIIQHKGVYPNKYGISMYVKYDIQRGNRNILKTECVLNLRKAMYLRLFLVAQFHLLRLLHQLLQDCSRRDRAKVGWVPALCILGVQKRKMGLNPCGTCKLLGLLSSGWLRWVFHSVVHWQVLQLFQSSWYILSLQVVWYAVWYAILHVKYYLVSMLSCICNYIIC